MSAPLLATPTYGTGQEIDVVFVARPTSPVCSKGWAGRCERSAGKRCKCRCGGRNHGARRPGQQLDLLAPDPSTLTDPT